MLLTITTTHRPATDLGFLLHKHPDRGQSFGVPFGRAHVFYPEAGQERCTEALMLDVDPVETDHGRSTAPGVRSGVNAFGCCAGPMQFSLVGKPSTSDRCGVDGNHDSRRSPYDPADAIPAAAR